MRSEYREPILKIVDIAPSNVLLFTSDEEANDGFEDDFID